MKVEDVSNNELNEILSKSKVVEGGLSKSTEEDIIRKSIEALKTKSINKASVDNDPTILPESNSNYWYIDGIPSRYKLYPEGTKIYGRPLKVLEIKKLSSINEINADHIINEILSKTIKGIRIGNLYIADKLFIVFWLRANTYRDSNYVVKYTCQKCLTETSYHFGIDNLEVQYLSDDYDPNRELLLRSGDKIKINFLTIDDSILIERFKEMNNKKFGEIDSELINIAGMIREINGNDNINLLEKYNFILNMDPGDFSYISQYIDSVGMGIKPYLKVLCKCGGVSNLGISFHSSFLFPEYIV